jgi:hypothetical protein
LEGELTLDGAGAQAVDALVLVGADDDVLEGAAVGDLEDGVLGTALGLATALDAAAVGLHATIKGALDDLGVLVGDGTLGGGDVEAEGALNQLRSRGSRGADGEGAEKGGGNEAEGRHCCC